MRRFYVYSNERGVKKDLHLSQAIVEYKRLKTEGYKTIGMSIDIYSVDLYNNKKGVCHDYKMSDIFRDSSLIKYNIIPILRKELGK